MMTAMDVSILPFFVNTEFSTYHIVRKAGRLLSVMLERMQKRRFFLYKDGGRGPPTGNWAPCFLLWCRTRCGPLKCTHGVTSTRKRAWRMHRLVLMKTLSLAQCYLKSGSSPEGSFLPTLFWPGFCAKKTKESEVNKSYQAVIQTAISRAVTGWNLTPSLISGQHHHTVPADAQKGGPAGGRDRDAPPDHQSLQPARCMWIWMWFPNFLKIYHTFPESLDLLRCQGLGR